MKCIFGLIILSLTLSAAARSRSPQTRTSALILRGRVPASTSIEWDKTKKNEIPQVRFNNSKVQPKVEISSQKDHRKITISHP